MQVFIVGSPLETAMALDIRRLNKQRIENTQILNALNGTKAWSNHPCVLQYKEYVTWLKTYHIAISHYADGNLALARHYSDLADSFRPPFHTQEYFDNMKKRLYTKDHVHYAQWAHLGESEVNWYWSQKENRFIKYRNGKRIK